MKRILICGLPGSGKTTLATRLVEVLGNADLYNADEVREKFKDWDFTPEGRERQMKRMQDYVRKSVAKDRYGVADFICPTHELRLKFMPEYVIWMNTIEESKYEDTNKIFESPNGLSNVEITAEDWWTEESVDEMAKLIAVDIKDSEYQSKFPTTQLLGTFQPFTEDNRKQFEEALDLNGQVAVMVRDIPVTLDNPLQVDDVCKNIEIELVEHAGKFRVYTVPNINHIIQGD